MLLEIMFWLKNKINGTFLFVDVVKLIFRKVQKNVAASENSACFVDFLNEL